MLVTTTCVNDAGVLDRLRGMLLADGFAHAYLKVPAAAMWALGQVPGLVFRLNSVAFAVSCMLALLATPVVLFSALQCVWALNSIGPARKTLSTTFLLVLWPLAVAVAYTCLAIVWFVLGLGVVAFIWVTPVFVLSSVLWYTLPTLAAWRDRERANASRAVAEDITFLELGLALLAAVVSACTTAPLVAALSLVKSPLVFLGITLVSLDAVLKALGEMVRSAPFTVLIYLPALALASAGVVIGVGLGTALSVLVKVIGAVLWPGYVACGMLRTLGTRRQARARSCRTILVHATKAAYQVVWLSDILTNASIMMRTSVAARAAWELAEVASGHRVELSEEVRRFSCLPTVTIGTLGGDADWLVDFDALAKVLDVGARTLEEMWTSFFHQMNGVGRSMLDRGMLTPDFVEELPPALLIGLPSIVLLRAIERSPKGQKVLVLARSGIKVTAATRPRGAACDAAWVSLMEAKDAHEAAGAGGALDESGKAALEAYMLAGGAPAADLPPVLAAAHARAIGEGDALPPSLAAIHKPLYNVVYKMAKEGVYKQHFSKQVYESLCSHEPRPDGFREGDRVEADFRGRGKFYPGEISRDRGDGTYDIAYDDGDREARVAKRLIRSKGGGGYANS